MTGLENVSIITLGVADVEASARFYTALGWPRSEASVDGTIHWFDVGGFYLGVYEEVALAVDSGLTADDVRHRASAAAGRGFRGVTVAVNLASREAVDAALATALDAGATQTLAPAMTDYDVYHACFADPDGHLWEVAWNPGFPVVDGRTVIP
jgi:predicted lactoylglutathione lyase